MSFHGGLLGVLVVVVLYARVMKLNLLSVADAICAQVPIGLFLGRIANFINGELYGRPSELPWAMVFPGGGLMPRHPSQLYEAVMEGLILFSLLAVAVHTRRVVQRPGTVAGLFLAGYGIARIIAELFREPDAFLGFILPGISMGQVLSLPMIVVGLFLILRIPPVPPVPPAGGQAGR
jgi:phosphatidylglycerol:prolipoprotein diacylglycerol transferase